VGGGRRRSDRQKKERGSKQGSESTQKLEKGEGEEAEKKRARQKQRIEADASATQQTGKAPGKQEYRRKKDVVEQKLVKAKK